MRIVFATDASRGSRIAEDYLLSLPLSRADDVTVVAAVGGSEREAEALLSRCRWRFAARDIPVRTCLRSGPLRAATESVSVDLAAELVVVGSRTGPVGPFAGDFARGLAASGTVSVLVVRERREAPRRVLVAVDTSEDGRAAVDLVARLPLPSEARMHLHHLDLEAQGDRGHVGEHILRDALAHGSELIILGVRGRPSPFAALRTGVADHVLTHAHCAVLLARAPLCTRRAEAHAAVLALSAI